MSDYRIEYTILRADDDSDDFEEIGFGSSGTWSDVDAALYAIQSDVQNRSWETEGDMPDPSEVDTDRENGSKSDG